MEEEVNKKVEPESIKLVKNSKGYGWEIKITGSATQNYKLNDEEFQRLVYFNNLMKEQFGDKLKGGKVGNENP